MKTVITTIIAALGSSLSRILLSALSVAKEGLRFLNFMKEEKKEKREDEKKEKERQKIQEHNDKVKDACDNGTIEDLMNL